MLIGCGTPVEMIKYILVSASVDGSELKWGTFQVLIFETGPQSFEVGTWESGTTCQTM